MIFQVLIDTGPMVAIFSKSDQYHNLCVNQLREIAPPLLTSWAVITEAIWLLGNKPVGIQALFDSLVHGLFKIPELDETAAPWLSKYLLRYRMIKAQLADASLVYLAERDNLETVFTLDRRDFAIYRYGRNRSFRILP